MAKKIIYILLLAGGFFCFHLFTFIAQNAHSLLFIKIRYLPFGIAVLAWLVLIFRMWQAMQVTSNPRTDPLMAVLLLLLPLINVFWLFQVVWGFAKDYNAFLKAHAHTHPQLNEKWFLCFCLLCSASLVPYVGFVFLLVSVCLFSFLIPKVIDAILVLQQS